MSVFIGSSKLLWVFLLSFRNSENVFYFRKYCKEEHIKESMDFINWHKVLSVWHKCIFHSLSHSSTQRHYDILFYKTITHVLSCVTLYWTKMVPTCGKLTIAVPASLWCRPLSSTNPSLPPLFWGFVADCVVAVDATLEVATFRLWSCSNSIS